MIAAILLIFGIRTTRSRTYRGVDSMSGFLGRFLANRVVRKIIEGVAQVAGSRAEFRDLLAERAQAGDLDAVYNAVVSPARQRAEAYVKEG